MAEASEQEILELGERASRFLSVFARADAATQSERMQARIDAALQHAERICAKARAVVEGGAE